jgi:hypoxanthine phosphoribosyltransferase
MSALIKPPVLFRAEEIQERVRELGRKITEDYRDHELAVVGILKGSLVFMADLIRVIERPLTCHFLMLQPPREEGRIEIAMGTDTDLSGQDVLLLYDVVDTGVTQNFFTGYIQEDWKPRSVKIATLIDREDHRKADCKVDYLGFKLLRPGFVVGYGLAFEERYRELPYLGLLENPPKP